MSGARGRSFDDDLDLEEEGGADEPRRPSSAGRSPRRNRPSSVRPWDAEPDGESEEEWKGSGPRRFRGGPAPVYWRARDSLYFEPLVAVAIVVLLLVGLYTFTQNWPPAYVVESRSMQHGPNDRVGLINAGDMVLAEKVPTSAIVPYVTGYHTGVATYGEFGDVVLYHPNGNTRATPIIHRAILFLQYDAAKHSYNATDLRGLPCGGGGNLSAGELYYNSAGGCGTTDLTGSLEIYDVGWNTSAPLISIDLSDAALGAHSGFLTMGDHNEEPDQSATNGGVTPALSSLVEPGWILGVARGMLPWFGAIKLVFEGNSENVSSGSWQFLGLSIVAAIFSAFGIHYALRQEGIESPIRRREEEERAVREEDEDDDSEPHGFLGSIRAWRERAEDDDEEEDAPARPRVRRVPPPRPPQTRDGESHSRPRPRPHRVTRRRREGGDNNL
ncbi:MAG: hypothetical protein ACLQD8_05920 [Thermoplasmata archaeon]